jgi:RNA recognition motif-containing protein
MNIYISGLSHNINDEDLGELFTEYGKVSSAKVINDRETGQSRGFGFVEMPNEEDGQKAIEELNGAEYDSKVITVSVARPKSERPASGGNRNRSNNGGFRRNSGSGGGNGGFGRY